MLGLCLALGLAASGIFLFLAEVLPAQILGIYSEDLQVIALGSEYLRIFGWSFATLYKVSPAVIQSARNLLTIVSLLFWLRVSNMIMIIGILRSGGDTRFSLIIDGYIIWFVGVPAAFIGAFVFHLPVHWVYLLVMLEEFTKWALGLRRFFSRKWIHNLAQTVNG